MHKSNLIMKIMKNVTQTNHIHSARYVTEFNKATKTGQQVKHIKSENIKMIRVNSDIMRIF